MLRATTAWIAAALLLLEAAVSAGAARSEKTTFPPERLGLKVLVGDGVDMGDFAGYGSRVFSRMGDCGIYLTRVGVSWGQMEEKRGTYNWWEADSLVDFWCSRGVEFHFTLIAAPAWARRTHPDDEARAPRLDVPYISHDLPRDEYLGQLSRWAEAVARRYRGRVRYYEWWNEPDGIAGPVPLRDANGLLIGGKTGGDAVRYALTLKAVHDGLKRGNPDAVLAAGSLSLSIPDRAVAATDPTDGGFMEAIYATVGKDAFEAITYHPYSGQGINVAWTETLRTLCVRNGDLDCELWANEYSWNHKTRERLTTTYGIGPGAEQLPQDGITLAAQYPYVTQSYVHTLNDWSAGGHREGNPNSGMGLLDVDLNPKPKYEGFKRSVNWRRDSLSREMTIIGPHVVFVGSEFALEFDEKMAPYLRDVTWSVPEGWAAPRARGDRAYAFRAPADAASAKPYPLTAVRADGLGFTHYVEVVEPAQLARVVVKEAAHDGKPAKVELVVHNLTREPMMAAPAFDLPDGWRCADTKPRRLLPEAASRWTVEVTPDESVAPGVYPCRAYLAFDGRKTGVYCFTLKRAAATVLAASPIRVDGKIGDWSAAGWQSVPGDIPARFATAWGPEAFYVACVVDDEMHVQNRAPKDAWNDDCLQIGVDAACDAVPGSGYTYNDYEFEVSLSSAGDVVVYRLHAPPDSYGGVLDTVAAAVVHADDVTIYEVAIPWREIEPAKPQAGSEIGLTVAVCDRDAGEGTRTSWGEGLVRIKRPVDFGRVRLAPARPADGG